MTDQIQSEQSDYESKLAEWLNNGHPIDSKFYLFGGKTKLGGWSDLLATSEKNDFKLMRVLDETDDDKREYIFNDQILTWYQIVDAVKGEVVKEWLP